MTAIDAGTAYRFEFFQFVRLLELGDYPGVPGGLVGRRAAPGREPVRFRGDSSLRFAPTAIESAEYRRSPSAAGSSRVDVSVSFLGLLGAVGELPWHYSETVRTQSARRDDAFETFANLLEHRSVSFFHRAWRKSRLPFDVEASRVAGETAGTHRILTALVGLATGLEHRPTEGADRWIDFASHFGRPVRSARGLQRMLEDVCACEVVIREFVGRWQELVPEEQTRLGDRPRDAFRSRLGDSAVLGSRVWDLLSCVEIELGPMSAFESARLAEQVRVGGWLVPMIQSYLDHRLDAQVRCRVDPSTISPAKLGSDLPLGRATWLAAEDEASYEAALCFALPSSA